MMIKSGMWPLQVAITTALRSYGPLMDVITGVHDEVPAGSIHPYVSFNSDTSIDRSNKTFGSEEMTATLSVWSGYKGKKEAKQIIDLIAQAITISPLAIAPGFKVGTTIREYADVMRESDTVYHGVVRFRFIVNQI